MDTRERLERDLAAVEWPVLRPHAGRGALLHVDLGLDLVEVANAIAEDDSGRVAAWIEMGLLAKPTPEQCSRWEGGAAGGLLTLIVQPYVLVQERPDS